LEEQGEKGSQACTVDGIGKKGATLLGAKEGPLDLARKLEESSRNRDLEETVAKAADAMNVERA